MSSHSTNFRLNSRTINSKSFSKKLILSSFLPICIFIYHYQPWWLYSQPNFLASFNSCPKRAAWCINFLGTQPTFTQVPPRPEREDNSCKASSVSMGVYVVLHTCRAGVVKHGEMTHSDGWGANSRPHNNMQIIKPNSSNEGLWRRPKDEQKYQCTLE